MNISTPSPMSSGLKAVLSAYIGGLNLLLAAALILLWPAGTGSLLTIQVDLRFFGLAAVAGALGSTVHLASSFVEHAAQDRLHGRWTLWYLLRPLIGSSLALLLYLLLRGGLIAGAGTSATESLNPYGITGLAALAGLFSRQAMNKLRETFEHLCVTREQMAAPPAGE